jgi:hypothetical protein
MKRIVFAIAVAVLSATPALAQYQTQPYQTQDSDPSAQVRMGGGFCEGAYDVKSGTNFGQCRGSAAKSFMGVEPESGGSAGGGASSGSAGGD